MPLKSSLTILVCFAAPHRILSFPSFASPSIARLASLLLHMAVIQDLPAELLEQILAETVEWNISKHQLQRQPQLALVASNWTDPAQDASMDHIELFGDSSVDDFLQCLASRRLRRPEQARLARIRYLKLTRVNGGAAQQLFELIKLETIFLDECDQCPWVALQQTGEQQSLNRKVCWLRRRLTGFHDAGVKHVTVSSKKEDAANNFPHAFPLVGLRLRPDGQANLPAVRNLFEASACTLTSLKLTIIYESEFVQAFYHTLRPYQTQIRHLVVDLPASFSAHPTLSAALAPLSVFTALQTLIISSFRPEYFVMALGHIQCSLVALELTGFMTDFGGDHLQEMLSLPAVEKLKRWRVDGDLYLNDMSKESQEWAAACEARGIEVRDERRYATGEIHCLRRS